MQDFGLPTCIQPKACLSPACRQTGQTGLGSGHQKQILKFLSNKLTSQQMKFNAKNLILPLAGVFAILGLFSLNCISRINNGFIIDNPQSSAQSGQKEVQKEMSEAQIREEMKKTEEEIKMIAVGDIMLSRVVGQKMIEYKDYKYPFLETADITNKADIVFGNLEGPIVSGRIIKSGEMIFRADLESVGSLKFAGFNVLNLANNHIADFGKRGLESTMEALDGSGILHTGAGTSEEEICKAAIKDVKGTKFAFLGYTYNFSQRKSSGDDIYGAAYMDTEKMKDEVRKAKSEADIVIVSMHAGTEYKTFPDKFQEDFARGAIDAGADLVIGHHPHVVQTVEKYEDGYILYSLGNFVFDQMWSNETRLGAIAEITFEDKEVKDIKFIPIKIYDYSQPRIIENEEAEMILGRLKH